MNPKGKKTVIWLLCAAALVLFARQAVAIALPFVLGALLALGAEPATALAQRRLHLPRPAAAGVGVGCFFVLLAALTVLLGSLLLRQLGRLWALLPRLVDAIGQGLAIVRQWLLTLTGQLPETMQAAARGNVERLFSDGSAMLDQAVSHIPRAATGLVGTLSQWALVLVTAVVSGCMISARLPQLRQKLPPVWRERWLPALGAARRAVGGWLLAQGKLMGLTFCVLSAGFFLLRIGHALPLAAVIALVDAFPVLGTGTVLLPWSLVCLLQGDTPRGIGLLGVYAVAWLLRSVLEPRLVGRELGVDPLLTLFAAYAGFCLLGLTGMLLSPFAAMALQRLIPHPRPDNTP